MSYCEQDKDKVAMQLKLHEINRKANAKVRANDVVIEPMLEVIPFNEMLDVVNNSENNC